MEWKLTVYKCLVLGCVFHMVHTQSCTQKVLVDEGTGKPKKVTVIRKVPARCSNWDKAWVWLTGMDCKTKYVKETVDFPSKTPVYREQKVCCPHEEDCKNPGAEHHTAGGLDENDEKFLAITFGSATAALVIILLIIVISFCRKQQPRFIENFFSRRQRMYEEDIIGVEPSAPYLGEQSDYRYKNGSMRLMESEYEEIPDYHSKDKYPIVESVSGSNEYIQELDPSERHSNNNQNDYTRDVLISLVSVRNEGQTRENTEETRDHNPTAVNNSDPYENAEVKMLQPMLDSISKVTESLSKNANEDLNFIQSSESPTKRGINDCSRENSKDNSPSKVSADSIPNDYIDFSNIVVPNCEQSDSVPPKAHSYEKLDLTAREKDHLEQTYDALNSTSNENNFSKGHS